MTEKSACEDYDFLQILNLQITAKALENEALMRYVSNPANFTRIGRAFEQAFETLVSLPANPMFACPPDYVHCSNCKCCSVWMRSLDEGYETRELRAKLGQLTMEMERGRRRWAEGKE